MAAGRMGARHDTRGWGAQGGNGGPEGGLATPLWAPGPGVGRPLSDVATSVPLSVHR